MLVFIIIVIVFTLPIWFRLVTRKWMNPYKLYLVFGKKGSGKSTYLCKIALRYLKKGWLVYTNMADMAIDNVRLIQIEHIGDFVPERNSVLLLDEVGIIWDARDYRNFKPSVRDFFKYQRHYKVICYMASQTFDVDKKIRDLTDGMYLCINVLNVMSIAKLIYKKIVLTESTSESESRIAENLRFAPFWNWKLTYIPKYAKYFDSFDVPKRPLLRYRLLSSHDASVALKALDDKSESGPEE